VSTPQTLLTGIAFGESPRWHDGRLWFADWMTNEVLAVDLDGNREVIATVKSFPMCIDWLPDGRLLIVSADERRLLRREPDGTLVTHGDLGEVADQPWNDIVVDGRGNAYVGSVGSAEGLVGADVLGLVTPDGRARLVADDVEFPNGMVVTPDNSTLIVAESNANRLTAFDIAADGTLFNRRVWADLGDGAPDGICLDHEKAVWYADVPHRRCVRVREGGEVLQTVDVDRACFACMLGGADKKTLFILAAEWPQALESTDEEKRTGRLLTAAGPAPGAGWP
jgi:sugar lactone lactonase YvrE